MLTPENLEQFKRVQRSGRNLIPIGSRKKPILTGWKDYQTKKTTEKQLEEWAKLRGVCGFAAIGGEISKGLIIIDFDAEGFYEKWCALVGEIADSLPTQTTNSGLYQVGFSTSLAVGNQKLAYIPADNLTGGKWPLRPGGKAAMR
jgi:Bifunctional DNA primase/polymerase, N-terminal